MNCKTYLKLGVAAAALALSPLAAAAQAKTEIVISNSQWLDALRGQRLWSAVETYEASHPDVDLVQEAIPSNEYDNRIMTEMGAGQGPDIVIAQEGLFYTLADAGFFVPLDDVTEGAKNLNATNENGVIDGTRLGIAWQRAVYALIYNKALLETAGATVPADIDA